MSYIALVDCNNFFVSCERVFNPRLYGKPVVVLSNNDGCIISRSAEAKALKIPMGAAHYQWADFLRVHDVIVFSSNFALYGDMSHRVMETLTIFNPDIEIYSVDEAFLFLDESIKDPLAHCQMIRQKVLQWTGIEVSIGIAKTKTLAKVANKVAKKNSSLKGVYFPKCEELDKILENLPVIDIWGIGSRLSYFLNTRGIHYADQLRVQHDLWVKKNLSVTGLKTVWELRGIPCLSIEEEPPPKQSLLTSRSFGRPVYDYEELGEAVASFAARAGEKMRSQGSLASWLSVFIATSFYKDGEGYANQASFVLSEPTDYTPTFTDFAKRGLERIFRPGFAYKRAGILLGGLVFRNAYQTDLFMEARPEEDAKRKKVMDMMDRANEKYDTEILKFAAEGIKKSWQSKRQKRTQRFTTKWNELLTIHI